MENKVNENDEDIKKQNASNNKQKLINDLCDNQTRDESKKNDFLDSIFLENKVPEDIIKDMLKADGEDSTILNKE